MSVSVELEQAKLRNLEARQEQARLKRILAAKETELEMWQAEDVPHKSSRTIATTTGVSDDTLVAVQRGQITPSLRYGNQVKTPTFATFDKGLLAAKDFTAFGASLKNTQVATRELSFAEQRVYTDAEFAELNKVSRSIAAFRKVPEDTVQDFLITMTNIDNIDDMRLIADATQISELDNPAILLQPLDILAITELNRIGYISSAFNALIKAFSVFIQASQLSDNNATGADSIFSSLSSVIGGFGSNQATAKLLLDNGSAETAPGSFMMEQVTGNRVPISVIAKNPQLHPPSYIGKTFFGEYPTSRVAIDMNETHAKRIAMFGEYNGGAAAPQFNFQNMGRFQSDLPLTDVINNILYNKNSVTAGTVESTRSQQVTTDVANLLNISPNAGVEMRRADNNIPVMLAVSAVFANETTSPFPSPVFKEGWFISSSVGNDLQVSNPQFMDGFRAFI